MNTNKFERPLYFAVTSSDNNRLDGLKNYQRMDGLLFQVTTVKGWEIDPEVLYDNLMNKFQFRNLNNPDVYYNDNIIGLLQNYRSAFFRLSDFYLKSNNKVLFKEVMQRVNTVMPPEVIPFTSPQFETVMTAFSAFAGVIPMEDLTIGKQPLKILQACAELGLTYKEYEFSKIGFTAVLNILESDPNSDEVYEYFRAIFGRNYNQLKNAGDQQWNLAVQTSLTRTKRDLVKAYKFSEDYAGGIELTKKWLTTDEKDQFAKKQLDEFTKLANGDSTE